MITGATPVFGLLGHPVVHSLSPALHNAWFAHHGINGVYVGLPTPPDAEDPLGAVRALGLAGVNLTIPHKTRALSAVEHVDPSAAAVGAINTVVRRGDHLVGANTDVDGFARALDELGVAPAGRRALVLGAGGAARAVSHALVRAGATVVMLNRHRERADAAAVDLGPSTCGADLDAGTFEGLAPAADLVVNTLPGPARPAVLALPVTALPDHAAWVDLNYWDDDPPHLAALGRAGHPVQTGHAMLLHQAALAFRWFTGVDPDVDRGRAVLAR